LLFLQVLSDLEQRLRLCAAEGEEIAADMPAHQATIKMGLNQAEERWTGLNSFIRGKRETMSAAGQYFDLLDESDRFLKDSSRILFEWSRRVSILNSRKDALNVKAEIERYIKAHKSRQSDLLIQLSSAAGQVFGNQPVASRLKSAQKEQTETFDALQTLLTRLDQFFSQQKNFDDEGSMNRRIQAETEANIKAAKAEAEAARRAAREAEESRRAAEEITLKAMRREVKVTKVICHETQTEGPRPHMAPDEPKERRVAPLFTDYLQDTVLTEGSRCLMKATVTGVPTPAITWFKDGVPVQKDNLDYNASFDIASGLCSLMIEETFVEDSANWSLRASNQAGYAESHAKLTVKEAKTIKAEFAPRITVSIKDGCADEGGQFEFKCRVEGTPAPATSWFKNGVCIDRSRNYTAGENDGGDCVLRIDKVYLEDGAEFALRAFNKLGSVSTSATLTVQPSEPIEMPTFDEPLPNLEVAAGHHILLECLVGGSPRPELQWSHNGKILRKNPTAGIDLFYEGNRAALKIGHAFLKYAGQYVCKARNIAGEATSTSSVTVKPITVETSDNEAAVENEFKPAFQVPLENMTVAEGDDCTLECVIVGRPEPEVTWYRNGIPIRDSPFHQFRTHGEVRKLILKGVDTISEGEYMVKVANDKGECQSTCSLRVMPAKVLIPISTQTSETNLVKTKPKKTVTPKFISQVQGKMAEEGEKAVFEGIIDGVPECKITWLYNSHPVRTSPDVRIQFENKMTTLTISKVPLAQLVYVLFLLHCLFSPVRSVITIAANIPVWPRICLDLLAAQPTLS
jgi:titin